LIQGILHLVQNRVGSVIGFTTELNTITKENAMRLREFADADEQIALFKLVTDKVWQSLADQKRAKDQQAAQRRQAAKSRAGLRPKRNTTAKLPKPIKPANPPKPSATSATHVSAGKSSQAFAPRTALTPKPLTAQRSMSPPRAASTQPFGAAQVPAPLAPKLMTPPNSAPGGRTLNSPSPQSPKK